jgi:peptidylprolyl isomerase
MEPVVSPGGSPAPTKLLTKDLVVGTGTVATSSSTVQVKYVGAAYTSGQDFTSSTWTQGKATSFSLHTVVPGFAEGIVGMKVGGRREIVIPPALGYGSSGSGSVIKPNETLVFVVDLEGVS